MHIATQCLVLNTETLRAHSNQAPGCKTDKLLRTCSLGTGGEKASKQAHGMARAHPRDQNIQLVTHDSRLW